MARSGQPRDGLLDSILGFAVGVSVLHAHAAVRVVDFYLDEARDQEKSHIVELVNKKDAGSAALLRGYVREAMREWPLTFSQNFAHLFRCNLGLRPPFPGRWYEVLEKDQDSKKPNKIKDRFWASFKDAHLDVSGSRMMFRLNFNNRCLPFPV